jgi:hypothetical protein
MSKRSLQNGLKPLVLPRGTGSAARRTLHSSSVSSFTLPLRLASQATLTSTPKLVYSSGHHAAEASLKRGRLLEALAQERVNHTRVFSLYASLLDLMVTESLPKELHQQVLRKCIPSPAEMRYTNARRIIRGDIPPSPHPYEARLKTVIDNMRRSGHEPDLDDFHFVLEQFAAVGHHRGAIAVYRAMKRDGYELRSKTFGLCLQAIAHRQTLSVHPSMRPTIIAETVHLCHELVREMKEHRARWTSVKLDLIMRILKESTDISTFLDLLRTAYGIDLQYPDKAPLSQSASTTPLPSLPAAPLPLSTSALNTIIDMLGSAGDVSRTVLAFEVLTKPLPPQASQHYTSSFEDEDDFGAQINAPESTPFKYPSAVPNTTSYVFLVKHMARNGHATLARHYINEAMELEHQHDAALHDEIYRANRLSDVRSPRMGVNRGTLLPAFGLANRDKDITLMRWVLKTVRKAKKRKIGKHRYYSSLLPRWEEEEGVILMSESSSADPSSVVNSTKSSADIQKTQTPEPDALTDDKLFAVDLDDETPPPLDIPKYLNLPLHISLLGRDIGELTELEGRVDYILGRSVQRTKEHLGRRVWAGKDVFLQSIGSRTTVSKETWTKEVGYRPRRHSRYAQLQSKTRPSQGHRRSGGNARHNFQPL